MAVHALNEMSCSSQVQHYRTRVRHCRAIENNTEIKQYTIQGMHEHHTSINSPYQEHQIKLSLHTPHKN
jgi:hypothetical protein